MYGIKIYSLVCLYHCLLNREYVSELCSNINSGMHTCLKLNQLYELKLWVVFNIF
jgi:hypothetical protein